MIAPAVLSLVASFVCGVAGTWLVRGIALRSGIVNQPNPIVPQHRKPIAYLGGVGITLGLSGMVFVSLVMPEFSLSFSRTFVFWVGMLAYLALGTLDDLVTFSPSLKFLWQAVIAIAVVACSLVVPVTGIALLDKGLTVLWILTVVNAVNFTDVCDGLVAGIIAISMIFMGLSFPGVAPVAWAVAGACVGFLVFNSPPASIFLGDAGSHLLGYLLAMLPLLNHEPDQWRFTETMQMFLLAALPLFELVFITTIRMHKGLPWWKGSPDHFALRLQHGGFSRWKADSIAWSIGVLLGVMAVATRFASTSEIFMLGGMIFVVLFSFWRFLLPLDPAAP